MNDLLKGAYDLHVHTAPDVVERKCTDTEMAKRWLARGMGGGVLKAHYADTSGRAAIVNEQFPQLSVYGGLALNLQAGGLNPVAVERMAQAGGKFLWFPTLDSKFYQEFRAGKKLPQSSGYITVLDDDGNLVSAVEEILEIVGQHNLVLGTGHLSPTEGTAVIRAAAKRGVRNMVVTHADNPANCYTTEQQKECVSLGAFIEHSYFTTYFGRVSWEQIVEEIKAVGAEHVILTTDLGQEKASFPEEGLEEYARGLFDRGVTEEMMVKMIVKNPEKLLK